MTKYSKGWYIKITIMMIAVLIGMMYVCVAHCVDTGAFAALVNLF